MRPTSSPTSYAKARLMYRMSWMAGMATDRKLKAWYNQGAKSWCFRYTQHHEPKNRMSQLFRSETVRRSRQSSFKW